MEKKPDTQEPEECPICCGDMINGECEDCGYIE